ncbi:MAG: ATP-dependent Clp protease adaptor ClpS [Methanobacteriota archaeon]|jgi:ATP-dependent Clp protease adaptor protein ClpS|nr:MAG: ATP-dependent Clp protease adaptor ClpS [Euryarchaeota archaeon]
MTEIKITTKEITDTTIDVNVKEPDKYKVLLINDDFTPMDFVIYILVTIFHHSTEAAEEIMAQVHEKGKGIAGVYTYEIAEQKAVESTTQARKNGHPLNVEIEEV